MVVRARHASVAALHNRVADRSTLPDGQRGASCTCLDQELPEQRAVTVGFIGAIAPDREACLGRQCRERSQQPFGPCTGEIEMCDPQDCLRLAAERNTPDVRDRTTEDMPRSGDARRITRSRDSLQSPVRLRLRRLGVSRATLDRASAGVAPARRPAGGSRRARPARPRRTG